MTNDNSEKNANVIVSVIMPVFNADRFLHDSLNDLLNQSFECFELICVDDGSTDGSGRILDEFAKKDSRITVIHQKNAGGGATRNAGMDVASGKYLLFLDADDRFESNLLRDAYKKAEATQCDVLVFNADTFDHKTGERSAAPFLISKKVEFVEDHVFEVLNTTVWNKLFLRQFILDSGCRFYEASRYNNTLVFVARALMESRRTAILNEVLVHYRTNNSESLIANQHKDYLAVYKNLIELKNGITLENRKQLMDFRDLAERAIADRLNVLKASEAYISLYKTLYDGGLRTLGFGSEFDFSNTRRGLQLKRISEKPIEEYLYWELDELRQRGIVGRVLYALPKLPCVDKQVLRIALYGAGVVGKAYFSQIMSSEKLSLSCWVDKKFEKIGYPVESPMEMLTCDYDIVLIAVDDEKVVSIISEYLVGIGITKEKIWWREPVVL